ncbi:DUF924 family protein [Oceanisphaera sp.]|uniref:DUF924 family protein n=1 Tax=Oceanisphaera sp. TaxID=1929979 RepID=UPI003A8E17D4
MYQSVLTFWFEELEPAQWWQKNQRLDRDIKARFGDLHRQVCLGELFEWRACAKGRLAEIIVLDQFSRNIYRDTPRAFAADGMALALAQEAISAGAEQTLTPQQRVFLYMPMMHSESLKIHELALALFEQNAEPEAGYEHEQSGAASSLHYERLHKDIIARFGRYPHRNAILGRESSAEEVAFLQQPGSSF